MATRGFENFTATDAARHALKHTRQAIAGPRTPQAGRSKYGAVKTTVDGITFHSKREAARYQELKQLGKSGAVIELQCQTQFAIQINGKEIARYFADFTYKERIDRPLAGAPYHYSFVVEDVKGVKTAIYRLKKKLVEALYGLQIREIR